MSNETCSHCGAERHPEGERWPVYQCGSRLDGAHRASRCYERQLAQKDEEIQRVLAANRDCIAWFEDARDEAIKLKQQLSALPEWALLLLIIASSVELGWIIGRGNL